MKNPGSCADGIVKRGESPLGRKAAGRAANGDVCGVSIILSSLLKNKRSIRSGGFAASGVCGNTTRRYRFIFLFSTPRRIRSLMQRSGIKWL